MADAITRERAERFGRGHPCLQCGEYSFKKLRVVGASDAQRAELQALWIVRRACGVCGVESELGLDAEGDVVFHA